MGTKLTLNEINKQLDKKNIDKVFKKSLIDKKNTLLNDKQVNK